ncbi:MAG: HDIG domain-containing protein [Candidatus Pacearchaeota archaeon]
MNLPITRERAWELILKYNKHEPDLIHYLESEAVMEGLAEYFGEDVKYWGMLGLLHDIDWGITKNNIATHLTKVNEILKDFGFDDKFIETLVSHGYGFKELPHLANKIRTEKVQYCLAAAETVTGLIHAYALMRGKKITGMDVNGLMKKFKDKTFAAKIDRNVIKEIEYTGLSLEKFFEIAIESIKKIKNKVGLD